MAELYDGKMWLPSGVFPPGELTASPLGTNIFSYYSSGPHSVADCNLLPSNINHRPYSAQLYRPAAQHGSLLQGGAAAAYGANNMFFAPVQLQVEMLRREEMMLRSRSGQNLGIPGGVLQYEKQKKLIRGPGGEYRGKGTGVFIPRTSVKNNVGGAARATRTREGALSSTIRNFSVGVDEKEKNAHFPPLACARIKQENQVHSHINSGKRFDAGKEAECHYQLPPELALPPEWTY
ncbi:uncharacterized protein LOC108226699 isoform X2 [Daucus carota subsp. sativus]